MIDTLTLAEFLTARITEGEARARRTVWVTETGPGKSHVGDAFRLAECEAKRQIVEMHSSDERGWVQPPHGYCPTCSDGSDLRDTVEVPCPTLRALALPYADHPDYREEWKP